jgi:uncharacterized repeat protein (TIGR02543 family)
MKKTVFFGLLAILLVFGFIGCDTGNGGKTTTYTVTFDSNGGSNVAAVIGITYGSTITLPPNPTKTDHDFVGWFIDNGMFQNEFTSSTVISSDLTVYAKWDPIILLTYTVAFDSNGGSNVAAVIGITYGSTITLPPNPTKADHDFVGWFIDNGTFENQFTASTVIMLDLTVYAKWIYNGPKTIKITGLDSYNGKYGYVFLAGPDSQYTFIASSNLDNCGLVIMGEFTVDLWEVYSSITKWSGYGDYYIHIGITSDTYFGGSGNVKRFISTKKINIQQKEITINYGDYTWNED